MRVLICFDICVTTREGRRRYRRVVKRCEADGLRLQRSVFQMELSYRKFRGIKLALHELIDSQADSLLFIVQHGAVERFGFNKLITNEDVWII